MASENPNLLDQDDLTYDIPLDAGENEQLQGAEYFFVTPSSGRLNLKQNLMSDESRTKTYRVSAFTSNSVQLV